GAPAPAAPTPPAPGRVACRAAPPATGGGQRPPMEPGRVASAAVGTGNQLLLWGGSQTADAGPPVIPPHGLAYDPTANRWSALPQAPLLGRLDPTAVWTGTQLIVWGGQKPNPGTGVKSFADGAAFTPERSAR